MLLGHYPGLNLPAEISSIGYLNGMRVLKLTLTVFKEFMEVEVSKLATENAKCYSDFIFRVL